MENLIIVVFVVGYLAITLEHNLKIDKLIPALIMMAMVLIASVSEGTVVKGLISGFLGMLASMPGVDPAVGV